MKGLIHGSDPKRICCEKSGVLKIGTAEITVEAGKNCIMPVIAYGSTAYYNATFTDAEGNTYDLGKIEVRNGRVTPPSPTAVDIMELRSKYESLEDENEALREEIEELRSIFDTNSLNFLIK